MSRNFFIENDIEIDCLSDADIKDLIEELKKEIENRKELRLTNLRRDFENAWKKLVEAGVEISYWEEGTREVHLINSDNFAYLLDD